MKKKIVIGIIGFVIAIFFIVFFVKYKKKVEYRKAIEKFPKINLLDYALSNDKFYNKGNINCFLIFNSECDFCLDEIEDIVDNIDDFYNVNFYLISNQKKEVLLDYSEDSEFIGLDNFTIICDKENILHQFFNNQTVPSTYVYSDKGNLIDYKIGFTSIFYLKGMIKN